MTSTTLSPEQLELFRDLVGEASGLVVPESQRRDLEKAILRTVEETGAAGTEALYRLLREHPSGRRALEALVGKITIGETHFFRNRPQFEALERRILPEVIARHRESRRLRLWSAGSATGEEAYSLAILVKRLIPDLRDWNVTILATDIDREALEEARRGSYRPWSFREVPEDIKAAWFTERDGGFELHPAIREMVTFDYLNLAEDVYPSLHTNTHAMDVVLCRNVLMYLRAQRARAVVNRMHDALSEGGWLLVGHTDPSESMFGRFEMRNLPGTVVYRKADVPEIELERSTPAAVSETVRRAAPRRHARAGLRSPGAAARGRRGGLTRQETVALMERERVREEHRRLERKASSEVNDPEAPYQLARMAANRLEVEKAERWVEVALRRDPLHAPSHYLSGLLREEDGRPDEALESYRRCVFADPRFALGHFALTGAFARAGQTRRARKSLENVSWLLADRERDEPVGDGDGMTVGRLLELTAVHREFLDHDLEAVHR